MAVDNDQARAEQEGEPSELTVVTVGQGAEQEGGPSELAMVAIGQPPPNLDLGPGLRLGEAEPPPLADTEQAVVAAPRLRRRRVLDLQWTEVTCTVCNGIAGQLKFDPAPGNRDGPSWVMRVPDPNTREWPQQGERFRRRRTSRVGDDDGFARAWIQENRVCCPQDPRAAPAASSSCLP